MGVFEKAIIKGNDILPLIPQRFPMVMVDLFYGIDELYSYSGLIVNEDNIFCSDSELQEPGIIEHVAQSAALRIGYICSESNKPVPVGFIGALKNFTFYKLPQVGEVINTKIKIEQDFGDITIISATVFLQNEVIASCEMKIFLHK